MIESQETLLSIKDLSVQFYTDTGIVRAVEGLNLTIRKGNPSGWSGKPARAKPPRRWTSCN